MRLTDAPFGSQQPTWRHYWIVDDEAPSDDRFLAYRLDGEAYRSVPALEDDRVRVSEPVAMEFTLGDLTG